MKPIYSFVLFAALTPWTFVPTQVGADDEQKPFELTTDNLDTLIGMTSDRFTVYGVRLGMSLEEALQVLQTHDSLIAEKDPQNAFVRVFSKGPTGVKSQDMLLTLNWESGPQLSLIALPDTCAAVLTPNFKRLFKQADAERPSAFVKEFLGTPSSRKLDTKYQKSGFTLLIWSYDAIGLTVQRLQSRTGNRVTLKLTKATQPPTAAPQIREWTDSTGKFKIRATLVKVADGNVTLRKADNKEIVLPLARLSAADREFLKHGE
ncbi:MAG: SHD1 domain-containing protein [Planctomycetota bacterium]